MPRAEALHYSSRRRATRSPTATRTSPTRTTSTCRSGLLSKDYAATRRALITGTAATLPCQPGTRCRRAAAARRRQSETTTHLTTSDKWCNVVSYTYTIESTGGSGLVVPGYGFLLNNELTDFNFDSTTHPNRVEGGKRPRSSMSPTIVLEDGKPFLAVGSPGGSMIITTVLQMLVDRLDLGLTLPQAIADPGEPAQHGTTCAEPAFMSSPEGAALEARGYHFSSTARDRRRDGDRVPAGRRCARGCEPPAAAAGARWSSHLEPARGRTSEKICWARGNAGAAKLMTQRRQVDQQQQLAMRGHQQAATPGSSAASSRRRWRCSNSCSTRPVRGSA